MFVFIHLCSFVSTCVHRYIYSYSFALICIQAAYGSSNPLYAVRQHAQSSMRASIGELELDEILHAR